MTTEFFKNYYSNSGQKTLPTMQLMQFMYLLPLSNLWQNYAIIQNMINDAIWLLLSLRLRVLMRNHYVEG